MDRTMWYPNTVKPVRTDWYEVVFADFPTTVRMYWWDGRAWRFPDGGYPTMAGAKWRGLTKPAERAA